MRSARHLAAVAASVLLLAFSACTPVGQAPTGFPDTLRWDLVPKWIQWVDNKAQITGPPNDGCAAAPESKTLAPGDMIDRYGPEGGSFFSPRGEGYRARAVPYVCAKMDYRVYRVARPLAVKSCNAAAWFDEPGGAVQLQTRDPVYKLKDAGILEMMAYEPAGAGSPAARCGVP